MDVLENKNLEQLFVALRRKGFTLIGPTVKDGAIILDEILSVENLPEGWTDVQAPASYSIEQRGDDALFSYVVGPQSWKKYLYPPRLKLFSAKKNGKGFEVETDATAEPPKYAFIGVRSCELHALNIQDKIFMEGQFVDSYYSSTRKQTFIVAVNCTQPGGNCFCVSMNTGPKATSSFDISLTEIVAEGVHHFVIEVGSEAGERVMAEVEHRAAAQADIERANEAMTSAAQRMGKSLDTTNIVQLLNDNFEHPEWDDVAKRCLGCANCTMVCPTCFCSTVEDVTDLAGDHAERWRSWDSCFTSDFTKIAGGNIRMSTRTRYRQWMMHKLAHWHEQFGTSGCVGCGRCITWCPVGIDITRETAVIRENSLSTITQ
jgi:ferredoxin